MKIFLAAYEEGEINRDYPIRWREEEFDHITKLVENSIYEEALIAGDRWIREMDQSPESDCVRAAAYVGLGDLFAQVTSYREQALNYYTDAVQLHPAYAEAYYKRGLCYLRQNCWKEAERDFDVATATIPTYLEAHLERATIFLKTFQYKEAERLYDRVLAMDKGNAQALIGKAKIFVLRQEISEARGCLNEATDIIKKILIREDLTRNERAECKDLLQEIIRLETDLKSSLKPADAEKSQRKNLAGKV